VASNESAAEEDGSKSKMRIKIRKRIKSRIKIRIRKAAGALRS
jgi:hypothetical protein